MIGFLPLLMADIDIVPGSVQKVSQVTGETDRERKRPTGNRTETRFGLRGTDLGASFEGPRVERLQLVDRAAEPSQGAARGPTDAELPHD